ncbi:2,3-epoxybenzoyl-CoA dihydrolase [bacterium]|nr:2,3-epoxybenzoyl-CoA dihydrolase [bacterium]MCI0601508.1 2,3-epoxybenzoyl-CoA dihydrolase [bacterium]
MISFETSPDSYRHWKLKIDGAIAFLTMDVQEDAPLVPQYKLKLNSYDLGVDIELADAVQRLRFEHPEVKTVVLRSGKGNIFCAGANIFMLGSSGHGFKVNFCKYTNETRLAMEDACRFSGQHYIAACNGTTAGGGYELALACDEIILVEDGNSAVSLPETPLLGVLPGTGGLTRVVDKRKVRRDRADVFCTLAEGIKGQRAVDWGLVDYLAPRSRFDEFVTERAKNWAEREKGKTGSGIPLKPLNPTISNDEILYHNVKLTLDRQRRVATLTVQGPSAGQPENASAICEAGSDFWPLRTFREIDHAFLHLRFNEPEIGMLLLKTEGDLEAVQKMDEILARESAHWFVKEILLFMKRTLKRLDVTSRTIFALIEPGSCFAGSLFELALAADRSYMLDSPDEEVRIALTSLNREFFPMSNGLTRIQTRFLADPDHSESVFSLPQPMKPQDAERAGLVTFSIDDLDYEDDVRVAIEERASLSPDALTGMESNLRFAGPETMETKIFGRLSAWQNWIFIRPNAVGEQGALKLYGSPQRPAFDWKRT